MKQFSEVEKCWIEAKAGNMPLREIARAISASEKRVREYIETLPPPPEPPKPVPPKPPTAGDMFARDRKSIENGKPPRFTVMTEGAAQKSDEFRKTTDTSNKMKKAIHKIKGE